MTWVISVGGQGPWEELAAHLAIGSKCSIEFFTLPILVATSKWYVSVGSPEKQVPRWSQECQRFISSLCQSRIKGRKQEWGRRSVKQWCWWDSLGHPSEELRSSDCPSEESWVGQECTAPDTMHVQSLAVSCLDLSLSPMANSEGPDPEAASSPHCSS